MLRVLVACEFSGTVREAFAAHGHLATSCDLLPTERPLGPGAAHIQGDVLDHLADGWDLMIAHPPCTHLALSGARWFKGKRKEQRAALVFVHKLLAAPIPRICLENPRSVISTRIRRFDQEIQPWQFGHPEQKTTWLWLKGLPPLQPSNLLPPPMGGRWQNQTASGQNKVQRTPDRWKIRSRTYPGIALAMASQWGMTGSSEVPA